MKKYRVRLYYHTFVDVDIEAPDRETAREEAQDFAEYLKDKKFMENIVPDGSDVMEWNKQTKDYE